MKLSSILVAATLGLIAACSSSTTDEPAAPAAEARRTSIALSRPAGALDLLPPPLWWNEPQIAAPLHLATSQLDALDAIQRDQAPAIERVRGESMTAARDLRLVVEADHATAADITAAGQRLKVVRGDLLDREVTMLADERLVLTKEQWSSLQAQLERLASEARERRREGGYGGRRGGMPGGGRGRPGGGRWPGML
jgi:hypothetical protein